MTKTSAKTIRLLLIDDHALFRESVARLLQAEPGFEVVADCGSGAEGVRILESREVDIVLLDVDLGQERGSDLLENLRTNRFEGKVLLVTAGVNESEVPGLIRKGISGDLPEARFPGPIGSGNSRGDGGKSPIRAGLCCMRALESAAGIPSRCRVGTRLTERERRVLSFIFDGLANKQIARSAEDFRKRGQSLSLQQLFTKTGVRTRSQLVRIALEQYRDQL